MKLIRAEIVEFGGLRDRVFEFGKGMNIIEGYNESGKSTLLAFIKFMLYGLPPKTGALSDPEGRERCLSRTGGRAAGSLTVEACNHVWRIEREGVMTHTARGESYNEKPVLIIDGETGTVAHKGKCPGELFLGVNAAVFNSTCSVAQLSTQNINSPELGNCIENILQSADESISLTRVCKRIDDARKELIHKNGRGGRIYDLKICAEQLSERRERAQENAAAIMRLEAQSAECRAETARAMEKQNQLSELWEKSEAWLILGRFEKVSALETELSGLGAQLDDLTKNTFPEGAQPDEKYYSQLNELSSQLDTLSTELSEAELRYRQHTSVLTYDTAKADIADQMSNDGITRQSLLTRYVKLKQSVNGARTFGTIALLCGIIALAGGGVSALMPELMTFGIGLGAIGLAGIIAGIILLAGIRKKAERVTHLLSTVGLYTDTGEATLARYIDECLSAELGKIEHTTAAGALERIRNSYRDAMVALSLKIAQAVKPLGIAVSDTADTSPAAIRPRRDALTRAQQACADFIRRRQELTRRIAQTTDELHRLKQSLTAYDEGFIRSRAAGLEREQAISSPEYAKLREQFAGEIRAAYDKQTETERQIAYREGQESSPARLAAQLHECRDEIERLTLHADAFVLAHKAMEEAGGKLRRGFTPTLRREAGKILAPLTDNRYGELGISDEFSLSLVSDGSTHAIEHMSGGTRDAAYLALRLALTQLLCPSETPPVMLDEALSQLDEVRARALLTLLTDWCDEGNQCILFTCHTREAKLAQRFEHIKL